MKHIEKSDRLFVKMMKVDERELQVMKSKCCRRGEGVEQ